MELTINEKVYNFKFGIGFVRSLDENSKIYSENGIEFGVGLETLVPKLTTKDTVSLADMLVLANKTETPRVAQKDMDAYLDNDDTDIENLFNEVVDELKKSNATQLKVHQLLKEIEANQ